MKTLVSAALILGVSLFATGCGEKEEAKYVRPSAGCKCAEKNASGKCQCNHCMGEKAQGKNALCYCGDGGCGCSAAGKTKCACGHCQGEADDPKCACKK